MARRQEETEKYTMQKGFAPGEKRMRNVPIMYPEKKKKFNLCLTPTAISIIKMIAKNQGTSASEAVERWARESQQEVVVVQKEPDELQAQIATLQEQNQQLQNELNNVVVPDYEAVRSQILKSMTTGKGSFASTSPYYKFASRTLDKFIKKITGK